MALVDFSNILGDRRLDVQQEYLQRHYEAVYLRRRAINQQRNKIRAAMAPASSIGPTGEAPAVGDEAGTSPVQIPRTERSETAALRSASPERHLSLTDMAARLTGKRKRKG